MFTLQIYWLTFALGGGGDGVGVTGVEAADRASAVKDCVVVKLLAVFVVRKLSVSKETSRYFQP